MKNKSKSKIVWTGAIDAFESLHFISTPLKSHNSTAPPKPVHFWSIVTQQISQNFVENMLENHQIIFLKWLRNVNSRIYSGCHLIQKSQLKFYLHSSLRMSMGLFTYLIRIVLHFNKQNLNYFIKGCRFFVFTFYRSHTLNIFWKIVNFSMKIWLANLSLLDRMLFLSLFFSDTR